MLKAIIMDFDGLIIDTEVVWYNIFVEWFKENKSYDLSIEEFILCVGSNVEDLFGYFETNHNCSIDRQKFIQDTQQTFIERSDMLPPKDGVVEFIKSVKNEGLKLALASSSTRGKPMKHLKRLGLIDYFDILVTAEDVKRIKPFPDLFLKAVEKMEVEKTEALVVEDSLNGIISANNAEIRALLIPNEVTKYSNFTKYYKKFSSLSEVNIKELISDF